MPNRYTVSTLHLYNIMIYEDKDIYIDVSPLTTFICGMVGNHALEGETPSKQIHLYEDGS